MLLLFQGILFGAAFGLVLLRKALSLEGSARLAVMGLAIAATILIPVVTVFVGARLVHRFSRSCRHRPLKASELRVVRRGQNLA